MADTKRTLASLQALLADNIAGDISPQDIRDFLVSCVLTASGSGADQVILQPHTADSTTFFQILDFDGGTPILNVDVTNERVGFGTADPDTLVSLAHDSWISSKDNAGTGFINMFKVNASDEIDVGGQLNVGPLSAAEDSGAITLFDMPVSATPTAGDEMSATLKIDTVNVLKVYAEADGSGGIQNQRIDVNGDSVRIITSQSPASGGAGVQGEIAWDASYLYVCTAANTWKRAALTGGY